MFHVGRFDPQETEKKKKAKKKRKREKEVKAVKDTPASTLRVIAHEAKAAPELQSHLTDEALDDFDVERDLLLLEDTEKVATTENQEEESQHDEVPESKLVDLPKEVQRALHMASLPISEAAKAWGLAPFLVDNLRKDGYETFFPIQALVIPDVIASERHSQILQCRDVCVAAPTGSGKTLAFCIPVLNSLSSRVVRRLRALVVLPSRDLASQVFSVFERYAEGSDLKIGLAIGQSDFQAEQHKLVVGDSEGLESVAKLQLRQQLDPSNLEVALKLHRRRVTPLQNTSAIDVLVATPGRLIDHLDKTPCFSLEHLRFLVIDEADRLVSQSYHSFVGRIMDSVNAQSQKAWDQINSSGEDSLVDDFEPITWRRPSESVTASLSIHSRVCQQVQLRKFLFSATMTKDPQKLASLGLVNPKYFDAHNLKAGGSADSKRYAMPSGLSEYIVESTAEQKPLFLLSLLLEHKGEDSILVVFTSSLDSTHRLARLLQLLWQASGVGDPSCVAEFSSALNQSQRSNLVKRCNETKEISVIVCSDGLSRGMDIKSVKAVINYDVPSFAKTYVHRCGRTARAGRKGIAISLLKSGQISQFNKMRRLIEDQKRVTSMDIKKQLVRDAFAHYKKCIGKLRDIIEAEKSGDLNAAGVLTEEYFC